MAIEKLLRKSSTKSHSPMISDECIPLLNYRIQQEELSSRIYKAMSMWLNNEGYTGAAALWLKYSNEELVHADWARDYLLSMGVQPDTPKLDMPAQSFTGLPQIIKDSYDHEIVVTEQIKVLADHALKYKDHMLYQLTLKYLAEQVEEHDKTQTWLDKLRTFGEDPIALRLLDNDMGELA